MLSNVLLFLLAVAVLVSATKNLLTDKKIDSKNVFLGKDSTNALKGFAIIMIAFSHICQYEKSLKELLIGGGIHTQYYSHGER